MITAFTKHGFALLAVFVSIAVSTPMSFAAEKPIWAKRATRLDLDCSSVQHGIESPDHNSSVRLWCKGRAFDDYVYMLRVHTKEGNHDLPLDEGAQEILWAPDSHAFFVNGSTSAYADFFVSVFQLNRSGVPQRQDVTKAAQKDMVASFPPCKAQNLDTNECKQIAANPMFNMSGVAWSDGSSAIDVFAEVPCGSSYGGIMCQVLGYEIEVHTGVVLKRLTARQVGRLWQRSLAWKFGYLILLCTLPRHNTCSRKTVFSEMTLARSRPASFSS